MTFFLFFTSTSLLSTTNIEDQFKCLLGKCLSKKVPTYGSVYKNSVETFNSLPVRHYFYLSTPQNIFMTLFQILRNNSWKHLHITQMPITLSFSFVNLHPSFFPSTFHKCQWLFIVFDYLLPRRWLQLGAKALGENTMPSQIPSILKSKYSNENLIGSKIE